MQQAVLLGLIVNELVTNAVKHAFPDGRAGRIRVRLEALNNQLRVSVEDDGVGFGRRPRSSADMGDGRGHGQELVRGLTRELDGDLEFESKTSGSSFRLTFPLASLGPPTAFPHSAAPLPN
jgi:two-component sensor histidine kinase